MEPSKIRPHMLDDLTSVDLAVPSMPMTNYFEISCFRHCPYLSQRGFPLPHSHSLAARTSQLESFPLSFSRPINSYSSPLCLARSLSLFFSPSLISLSFPASPGRRPAQRTLSTVIRVRVALLLNAISWAVRGSRIFMNPPPADRAHGSPMQNVAAAAFKVTTRLN